MMDDGLGPMSSLLLKCLSPGIIASSCTCATRVKGCWRWWCCSVAPTPYSCTSTRCCSRAYPCCFSLGLCRVLFPLPPPIGPLDGDPPLLPVRRNLRPSPLLVAGVASSQSRIPRCRIRVIEFIVQFDNELFDRMTETHARATTDSG